MTDQTFDDHVTIEHGVITITWDGGDVTRLRRPTIAQMRRFAEERDALEDRSIKRAEAKAEEEPPEEPRRDRWMDLIPDEAVAENLAFIRLMFNGDEQTPGLADRPLEEDDGALPAWLGLDATGRALVKAMFTVPPGVLGGPKAAIPSRTTTAAPGATPT